MKIAYGIIIACFIILGYGAVKKVTKDCKYQIRQTELIESGVYKYSIKLKSGGYIYANSYYVKQGSVWYKDLPSENGYNFIPQSNIKYIKTTWR